MPITIRDARATDREAILALVPRLRAFGPSDLRSIEDLDGAESDALSNALASLPDDAALIVAEIDDANHPSSSASVVGVAFMHTQVDYFTHERHGHLGILSVAESAEGSGVGRALLDAVDNWAREMGYRFITLNVFAGNHRARKVYERAGYAIDAIRYAKVVR